MSILLAAAPILISIVSILALRQSALRAGAAGLATALLVVLLAPAYRLAPGELGRALLSGGLTTLLVSYVLFGGLLVYTVLREAGALYGSLSDGEVLETGDMVTANGEIYKTFHKLLTS